MTQKKDSRQKALESYLLAGAGLVGSVIIGMVIIDTWGQRWMFTAMCLFVLLLAAVVIFLVIYFLHRDLVKVQKQCDDNRGHLVAAKRSTTAADVLNFCAGRS